MVAAPGQPAFAQLFSDNVARDAAARNGEKLEDLARIVENLRGRLGKMAQQQQAIDLQLRELVGRMEESQNAAGQADVKTLAAAVARGAAERAEITEKLDLLSAQFAAAEDLAAPPEAEIYEAASSDYRREEYARAAAGFQKLLRHYPGGQFHINARYWLCDSLLAAGDFAAAADAAADLIALGDAGGDKIPDAMLVLARAQKHLGRDAASRATLESLTAAHPTALAADRARRLLAP